MTQASVASENLQQSAISENLKHERATNDDNRDEIRCSNINVLPLSSIKPRTGNPRKHSQKQIKLLARSILHHGFVTPILVDQHSVIIAGEGRWRAARSLGLQRVPTVAVTGLTDKEIRTYVVADNQLALKAEWDLELLSTDLKAFEALGIELDILGFEAADVDLVFDQQDQEGTATLVGEAIPPIEATLVTQLGDLWRLGRHRLLCGDARDEGMFRKLLGKRKAQMVFTDPPYNVAIDGHVSGLGATKHREFVMASGEMSPTEFRAFLERSIEQLAQFSDDGSIHYICMDWRHMHELLSAALPIYTEFKNLCVWNKTNAGMGTFYRSRHELICVFKNGKKPHINNFELGQHGRNRTNVWDYAGVNTFGRERLEELSLHPTVKPVALIADAIKDCSKRGGLILDPFGGSGSTLMAAEITGRTCATLELDPRYADVIIRRWQKATGEAAVHAEIGQTFHEYEASKRQGAAHG